MQDYAKLYRREHRRRVVMEEKIRRIRKTLNTELPKTIVLAVICLIVREQ